MKPIEYLEIVHMGGWIKQRSTLYSDINEAYRRKQCDDQEWNGQYTFLIVEVSSNWKSLPSPY